MVVADIGSDHAFLPIYLIQNKLASKVYASDNKKGPLNQAKNNIDQAILSDQINTYLADGLDNLPQDVDTIIIAGMGVDTIINILNKHMDRLFSIKQIIVQPNNNVHVMRHWINDKQFFIEDELLIKEYKYYQIIAINPQIKGNYSDKEIYFGPKLLERKDDIFNKYHHDMYRKLKQLYDSHPQKKMNFEYQLLMDYFK
jgi:tRNA (adenine22-N1)-methyltransferase